VSNRSKRIGSGLEYNTGTLDIRVGSAVRVPLRTTSVEGIVISTTPEEEAENIKLKTIEELLWKRPLLTAVQLGLVEWIAAHYCCTPRQVLSLLLPPPPWDKLLPPPVAELRLRRSTPFRGKKQLLLTEALRGKDWVAEEEIVEETGVARRTLKGLLMKGVIERRLRPQESSYRASSIVPNTPKLSPAQSRAREQILADTRPALLFGAHGSGKSAIYASLIAETVQRGEQAILLMPELKVTGERIGSLEALVGKDHIAFMRGDLPIAKRRTLWQQIWNSEALLVVGSRSALFSPCANLGLIIIDDEHDWTWKNEQTPRFHTRDAALKLGALTGARVVLGSASPSLESWAQAQEGRFRLVRLQERYRNIPYPSIRIINLHEAPLGKNYPLSPALLAAIDERLRRKEQSLLLMNKRGLASSLLCLECRQRLVHPETKLPYTVHQNAKNQLILVDHMTGAVARVPARCPHCGSTRLHAVGAGTQRLQGVLQAHFPCARLLRIDRETLADTSQPTHPLAMMQNGQYDIFLGTQSVLKGMPLPSLTLVAVVLADLGLSLPHFRAGERVWQLLSSITGWYHSPPGEVFIQTFQPDAPEILAAAKHDCEKFLHTELQQRTGMRYPPATAMIRILCKKPDAQSKAQNVAAHFTRANKERSLQLSVTCSPTLYSGGAEWHVLLRGENPQILLQGIDLSGCSVDVDPMVCL
jgi:primosomal protein N' (replication factor Y)